MKADISYLSNRDGLSNSSVICIYQDSQGFMWFGTWDGLNRYDGRQFDIYRPTLEDNSISSSIVRDVIEDREHNLWVVSDRGIDRFDRQRNTFKRYFSDIARLGLKGERSFFLSCDSSGQVLATVSGYGEFIYDMKTDSFRQVSATPVSVKYQDFDFTSKLWTRTDTELTDGDNSYHDIEFSQLNREGNIIWVKYRDSHSLTGIDVKSGTAMADIPLPGDAGKIQCTEEWEGYVYVGFSEGLYRFSPEGCSVEIRGVSILSLFGQDQILWVGTDMDGLIVISEKEKLFKSLTSDRCPAFSNAAVRSFYQETPSLMWVGTKGNGLVLTDLPSGRVIESLGTANGLPDNNVYSLCEGDEIVWVGTDGDGLYYIDKKHHGVHRLITPAEVKIKSVYAILQSERNVLWVGTSGYGLYRLTISRRKNDDYEVVSYQHFSKGNGLESDIIYALGKDKGGLIWVGSRGGGIRNFSYDGCPVEIAVQPEYEDALKEMTCIHVSEQGTVWMGTSLGVFSYMDGEFERLDSRYIAGSSVHGIIEDINGMLWVSTNNGLVRIDRTRHPLAETKYAVEDGLQNNEFSDGAFYRSPYNNELFFGGISGFSHFNSFLTGNSSVFPPMNIKYVMIDNQRSYDSLTEKNGKLELVIEPGHKTLTLEFATMDYLSAEKCELSYMLEGYTDGWVYLGTSMNIAFSNLSHGDYTLKVRHSNSDKLWSDDIYSMDIRVLPQWYETLWAKMAFAAAISIALILFIVGIQSRRRAKKMAQEEEAQRQKTNEIHEAKLRFFTNIAHEFSNSLTLIYGPCKEMQKMNSLPPKGRKYLDYIATNSSRMLGLIQQLIDFRKAETDHLSIHPEEVDINALVERTENYFKGKMEEKSIRLVTDIRSDDIKWVTDLDSIEKIFFNLLSNATKYTPAGGQIDIICFISDGKLTVEVRNTGLGIPQEKLDAIFDRFEVLDRFESNIKKGKISNGIGLSLCKTLVEIMNGNIWVESDGSTYASFIFSLPMLQADEKPNDFVKPSIFELDTTADQEEEPGAERASRATSGKRILIVDDDENLRHFVTDLLSDKYVMLEAGDGLEGLECIQKNLPDLVISDVSMPQMDGFQLLKRVRQDKALEHIPIVLLTSSNSDDSKRMGLDHGADAFISKPFSPDILLSLISNKLGRDEAILRYTNSPYSAMDRFRGIEMKKEDKEALTKMTDIIQKHIDSESLCMDFIADEMSMSKMKLYRMVKSCLGTTPVEYIKTLRLEKAAKLLVGTSQTVQQIMYECGFNTKTYFYREFDKKYGCTPKQYRDEAKENIHNE
ncbi:MAG: response regulator [Candidatus Cryptobacteroides sp.]